LLPRLFIAAASLGAMGMAASLGASTGLYAADIRRFLLLLGCGLVSVAATPRNVYLKGGMSRDFLTVWVLPVAILLPPVYAMLTPIPLLWLTQVWVHRGVVYRRVFTVSAMAIAYGTVSLIFRAFPSSVTGHPIGFGSHAVEWALAVTACELCGWLIHHFFLVAAIKLTDPSARVATLELNRESLQADFAQIDLGVVMTVLVGVSPLLAVFGVPTVLLARRFMMYAPLVAQSRTDSKTGLLNSSAWENEADTEIARAVRTNSALSVALVDIDHFKAVNDTYGHLVGDMALRAVADAISEQLRSYDVAGRFGGEEFVILLPHAAQEDAMAIAERLRTHIAAMSIPVGEDGARSITLTVSVGVAALDGTARELTDLLAAADSALYYAKENGRNKTHAMAAVGLR
jgi:diguanylate cyclase (GGDEF)-like protein